MNEIKLTKRGQAIANKARKNQKSKKKVWNYADYCKNYEKILDAHKKSNKISRFFSNFCTVTVSTVCEKIYNLGICSLFNRKKRNRGGRKISPAA